MGQCGRSAGKTEEILYIVWRFSLCNPGSETYIICPEIKQAKKIYWLPKRLQNYGPQKFVYEHRESELRTVFTNGSHIILDGCENYDAMRGIKPDLAVYDEFQKHSQFFDEEVMQPNLSSGKVSLVVMGTPPKRVCYYTEFRDHHLESIANGNQSRFYVELPSDTNPTLDKAWLMEKKAELFKRKKENVWYREYEGKLVFDTESAIFPFFSQTLHCVPSSVISEKLSRDKKKLEYYAIFDPGTSTVFAALFIALNRYTSQVYILDEIYAKNPEEMTATAIWRKATHIKNLHCEYEDRWNEFYDEAATWFANEIRSTFGAALTPTTKQKQVKLEEEGRPGESLLNTLMMEKGRFFVSDKCVKFIWEMENYVKDESGKYPTDHDHLVDTLFYFAQVSHLELIEKSTKDLDDEVEREKNIKTIGQLFNDLQRKKDIVNYIEEDYYDSEEDIWTQ